VIGPAPITRQPTAPPAPPVVVNCWVALGARVALPGVIARTLLVVTVVEALLPRVSITVTVSTAETAPAL
jgi:hypothetical protein